MKILLPIDGSECSQKTLIGASRFLNPNKNQISLLTVISTPKALSELSDAMLAGIDMAVEEAEINLQIASAILINEGFHIKEAVYRRGNPGKVICEYADRKDIDQIIIGSHGRQGLAKFLLGSVSQAVFEHANVPVFVLNNARQGLFHLNYVQGKEHVL